MTKRATEFHANEWQGVFYITGGGSRFIEEMLTTPGASGSVLEVRVPYASQALSDLLGRPPEQACSSTTARQLAVAAYERARQLGEGSLFGLGCTASLGTNRMKRGEHRAHWAVQTAECTFAFHVTYHADRATEEAALLEHLWIGLNHALLDGPLQDDAVNVQRACPKAAITALYDAEQAKVCIGDHDGKLILPGSFNPLHDGHRRMLALAEQATGLPGAYELAVMNADKPNLDFITLEERLTALTEHPVWLTNTPNFSAKAELFPGVTFALGVDTLARIGELRFYNDSPKELDAALSSFVDSGARFVVFGRLMGDRFVTLADVTIPDQLRDLCSGIDEENFRSDVSSTKLRQIDQGGATD